jgi:hypothetical protein
MRLLACCLGLLLAAPASANSFVDAMCGQASVQVVQMAAPEKLCRSFALALPKLPTAVSEDARELLTPENLAAMVALTAAWVGTQGVPVVGQAVDAALLALGVTLLMIQAAEIAESLWKYANHAREARTLSELDAAATFLAQAISRAGINVVAFVLTKRALGKVRPPPPAAAPRLSTPQGSLGSSAILSAAEPATLPPAVAATGLLAQAPGQGGGTQALRMKTPEPKKFEEWLARAVRTPVREESPATRYQVKQAGPDELTVSGGGSTVRADGARTSEALLLEVKHVESPSTSPYVPGSGCSEYVRLKVQEELMNQFGRYAAVIRDPATPAVGLEVITNEARAAAYFEALMKEAGVPGRVTVSP